jgi:hypothetical protein
MRLSLLLDVLPFLIHLRGSSPEAVALQQRLGHLYEELRSDRSSSHMASTLLTQLVSVQALRGVLTVSGLLSPGWLRALREGGSPGFHSRFLAGLYFRERVQ